MIIGISGKIGSGKDTAAIIIQGLNMSMDLDIILHQVELGKPFEKSSGFEVKKFASKLKDITCLLLGCTREQLEDREFKEKELGEEWDRHLLIDEEGEIVDIKSTYQEVVNYYGEEGGYYLYKKEKLTPRLLLQLLGTECGRQIIHSNIWVNALMSDYTPGISHQLAILDFGEEGKEPEFIGEPFHTHYPNWIITDVRFPNEAEAVKEKEGILIRINAPDKLKIKGPAGEEKVFYDKNDPERQEFLKKFDDSDFEHTSTYKVEEHPSETALDNYKDWDHVINNNGSLQNFLLNIQNLMLKEKLL